MATNAYATTAGTLLYYGDSGTADPATQLAGIKSFPGLPTYEVDEIETTRVDQEVSSGVIDWYKQFAPDRVDPGELEVELAFIGATSETVYGLVRTFQAWKILFSNGDTLIFEGFIKTLGPEAANGDEIVMNATIRVSGKPTFTKFVAA